MASVVCRVQFLDDSDPFICTNFPEPRRPPTVSLEEDVPLSEQVAGIHKLLEAPLKVGHGVSSWELSGSGLVLLEQKDELENFYEDLIKGKKPLLILRTQLSVRVHAILAELQDLKWFLDQFSSGSELEDCALQVSPPGNYLDLDSSLLEQKDELENFYEDLIKGKKPLLILRTQLSVRVHAILEKLYNSQGPELRRSLFSLKQLFQVRGSWVLLERPFNWTPKGTSRFWRNILQVLWVQLTLLDHPVSSCVLVCGRLSKAGNQLFPGQVLGQVPGSSSQSPVLLCLQDDEDLVPEFVACDGLMCFIRVGAEADHNYQNYILRALSQIMLFVDGMNGVIQHNETLQWLYTLTGSQVGPHRWAPGVRAGPEPDGSVLSAVPPAGENLSEAPHRLRGVFRVQRSSLDHCRQRCGLPARCETLELHHGGPGGAKRVGHGAADVRRDSDQQGQPSGCDWGRRGDRRPRLSLRVPPQTLAVLPDQDSFYDVTDSLEQLGMERIMEKHMKNLRTEPDLRTQFSIYEGGSVPAAPRHRSPTSQQPWSSPPAGAVTDEEPKSPSSLHHMSALGLSRKSRLFSRTSTEEPPAARDTFLRSLAAAQWDKKRRSKHLSETRESLSDDIRGPDTPPAEGGGATPQASSDTNGHPDGHSESVGDLSRVFQRLSSLKGCWFEPSSPSEHSASRRAELEGLDGSAQAA
ncbi:unnamed protein product [Tetraodon nigroviridis]|uniref:(spotted green pufferfish) hypothetical protein n=1 Tax=Tetraodon nigroviridis TaxID=99883 RepID=Q4T9W4_TETNG|nr:unnamed protein product [Tetraodon nigroviridis]